MKTHTHYTTPIALAPWVRRGAVALSMLLIAAAAVALIAGLRSSLYPTVSSPAAPAPRAAIPRVFQDEINGAAQASIQPLTAPSSIFEQQLDELRRFGPR